MGGVIKNVFVIVLPGFFTVVAAELPPNIMVDKYLLQAEQLIGEQDYGSAFLVMNKIVALQRNHNLTAPDVFYFKYAQIALKAGAFQIALDAVKKYLVAAGQEGEFYREALELLNEAEQLLTAKQERIQNTVDSHLAQVKRFIAEKDYGIAINLIKKIVALQKEHNLTVSKEALVLWDEAKFSLGPEMVVIPGGRFLMGCVSDRDCADNEKPVHEVTIGAFALSKYEVTFEEYDRFTAATGRERVNDEGWGRGRRPVINISWEDAAAYTLWLSAQTGMNYRLPSEAEWEYAARAGSEEKYSWGNEIGHDRANCAGCGSLWDNEKTAPVGSFSANGWGLHDMHGNVWEWVQDCYNDNYRGAPADGSAWASGDCSFRIRRGGSWLNSPKILHLSKRSKVRLKDRNYVVGFRIARHF